MSEEDGGGEPEMQACMTDSNEDGRLDIYPVAGPIRFADFSVCSDTYTGPVELATFAEPDCSNGLWEYRFETSGLANGMRLYTLDTAGGSNDSTLWWGEVHDVGRPNVNEPFHPDGWWDRYAIQLPVTSDFQEQVDGENTLHSCSTEDDVLVWGLEVLGQNDEVVDCVTISDSTVTDDWISDFTSEYPQFADCPVYRWNEEEVELPEPPVCELPETGALSDRDYAGCGMYQGDVEIAYFPSPTCENDTWSYVFENSGWGDGMMLYVLDNAGGSDNSDFWWSEQHEITDNSNQENRWWDRWSIELPVVTDFNEQEERVNSFHSCQSLGNDALVWGVELYDYENPDEVIDCLIFSESETTNAWIPDLVQEFPQLDGCQPVVWQ